MFLDPPGIEARVGLASVVAAVVLQTVGAVQGCTCDDGGGHQDNSNGDQTIDQIVSDIVPPWSKSLLINLLIIHINYLCHLNAFSASVRPSTAPIRAAPTAAILT